MSRMQVWSIAVVSTLKHVVSQQLESPVLETIKTSQQLPRLLGGTCNFL